MFAPLVEKPKAKDGALRRAAADAPRPDRSANPGWKLRQRAIGVQAQLRIAAVDDPLEREADRVAARVLRMPEADRPIGAARPRPGTIQPKLRAGAGGGPLRQQGRAPGPDSFRGRGESLPAKVRGFFERWLGHDFGGVRLHRGADAAASARSLGARAYTYGRDIVFGAGEYAPGSERSKGLLAHELTHVVQQGAGPPLVQRQKTSDPWLNQRLDKGELGWTSGEFGPRNDGKSDPKEKGNPIPRKIEVVFIAGTDARRALVIAGVHGSERQGMEAARMLIADLQNQQPFFTTIVIPSLFPDSEARGAEIAGLTDAAERQRKLQADEAREYDKAKTIPTNRNFPKNFDFAAWLAAGSPRDLKDAEGLKIVEENLLLMELIERFKPERIISIHGTKRPGEAGVFYDPRVLRADEEQRARGEARGAVLMLALINPVWAMYADLHAVEEQLYQQRRVQLLSGAEATDLKLSLDAASQIDLATKAIDEKEPGKRNVRDFTRKDDDRPLLEAAAAREKEKKKDDRDLAAAQKGGDADAEKKVKARQEQHQKAYEERKARLEKERKALWDRELPLRRKHPSIGGNIDSSGNIGKATWGGDVQKGVSLGMYAPARGISVFTVEPPLNYASGDQDRRGDKIGKAVREKEVKAYADAIRTILLGTP